MTNFVMNKLVKKIMKLQDILKNTRKQLKLTILEVSKLSGIDQALLSKYENGQRMPSEYHITQLTKALQISYSESLLSDKTTKLI